MKLIFAFFALSLIFLSSSAADLSLSAGIAAVEITPPAEMMNWVYQKPYGEVHDPLFVRALVISDGTNRVALLSLDLVELRESLSAEVRAAIARDPGIRGDHVMLNSSHSHSAPFPSCGSETLTLPEQNLFRLLNGNAPYRAWAARLPGLCVEAVKKADARRQPATLGLARAWAGEVLFNRRPVCEDGTVKTTLRPDDPYALPEAQRFGPVDPTLTWLSVRDNAGKTLAAVFHLAVHSVSVYGEYHGISADWPGAVANRLRERLGAETMFLQGCAGDIVPWRRGLKNVEAMTALLAERALAAEANRHELPAAPIRALKAEVDLPYDQPARREAGLPAKHSEVQVITCGQLAIVALPGEPLTKIGMEIRERSPFPHTLVLGYSNDSGVQYVGVAGEIKRGGYEMGVWRLGEDQCGTILIDTAVRLLNEARKP